MQFQKKSKWIFEENKKETPSTFRHVLCNASIRAECTKRQTPCAHRLHTVWQGVCYLVNYAGITFCCFFCL